MKERYTPNSDKACDELLFVPYNYSAAKWSIWWLCLLCKKKTLNTVMLNVIMNNIL